MRYPTPVLLVCALMLAISIGCNSAPGRPALESEVLPPDRVLNFERLYQQNCAGCHGSGGLGGAAVSLSSGVYLAIAGDDTIRRVTAEGVPGTVMPAFAQSSGGMLTDEQINAIVSGIRTRWGKAHLSDIALPSYAASTPGDSQRGVDVYRTYCSSCHGDGGRGGARAGSIVDGSYLTLVSDQYLRTIVIVGRPEMGAPDWRDDVPGKPMSQQEISDVVAWLAAQRPKILNQAYSDKGPVTGGVR
jgi:cytochrome c oxidase cbb3-type subunit 3